MYFLYNFLLISFLIVTFPFWIFKILTKEKHRKGIIEKFGIVPSHLTNGSPGEVCVHIHAVSVGEVMAVIPFIKELKKRHPEIRLTLSTVTPAGNEVARKRLPEADHILYFPFDLPWVVRRVIRIVKPHLYVTVETELWPNFLREVKHSGTKSILINGRISPRTFKGYSLVKPFMRRVLAHVDLFCMQSDEDARRIKAIGAPDDVVVVTGNMKYDQRFVDISGGDVIKKRGVFGINADAKVVIAGSTHKGEEEIILRSYGECLKDNGKIRLIIVPRHIERAGEIESLVRTFGLEAIRRTELNVSEKKASPSHISDPRPPVIIVDTIGELATLYCMATVVIIGGSFIPHGGQNPLEAIYYRKPVVFGPHMFNFREITGEILENGAGVQVEKGEELTKALRELLNNPDRQREMGEAGHQIITKNRGAVERNLAIVEKILSV